MNKINLPHVQIFLLKYVFKFLFFLYNNFGYLRTKSMEKNQNIHNSIYIQSRTWMG